jgi:hypothetical protein
LVKMFMTDSRIDPACLAWTTSLNRMQDRPAGFEGKATVLQPRVEFCSSLGMTTGTGNRP